MYLSGGLHGADLLGLIILIYSILLVPPIVLFLIGFFLRKKRKEVSKTLYIIAVAYLLIGLSYCL